MTVSTRELRAAAELLLKHLEEDGLSEIDIPDDFYWDVPADVRYDRYEKPNDLVVGQLTDDWNEVQLMLSGERPPIALVWLAAVLRRVGERVVA